MQDKQQAGQDSGREAVGLQNIGDPEEKKHQQSGDIQPAAICQLHGIADTLFNEEGQHASGHHQDQSDDEVEAGVQSRPFPLR